MRHVSRGGMHTRVQKTPIPISVLMGGFPDDLLKAGPKMLPKFGIYRILNSEVTACAT